MNATSCKIVSGLMCGLASWFSGQTSFAQPGLPAYGSAPLLEAAARARGLTFVAGKPKIIGGVEATIDEHPWQVALLLSEEADNGKAFFCGGSAISAEWVVTAAHCVDRGTQPNQVHILAGTHNLASGTRVGVSSIHVHPSWNSASYESDIALLRLASPIKSKPIGFVSVSQEAGLLSSDSRVTVSGWGVTTVGGAISPRLKSVTVPLVPDAQCKSPLAYGDRISPSMLCAGELAGGKDSCQGDSGGPLVAADDNQARRLIGIVSWGESCAQANKPGVYTRTTRFASWVQQTSNIDVLSP